MKGPELIGARFFACGARVKGARHAIALAFVMRQSAQRVPHEDDRQ
jgi:hypothetical protein